MNNIITYDNFEKKLIEINNQTVLLANDVAQLYGVETKHLNRMVGKYIHLFPKDYRFKLTKEQNESLRCMKNTSKSGSGGNRYLPYVYTEKGLYMLATILTKSNQAKEIHFYIIETFSKLKQISKNLKLITQTTNQDEQKQLVEKSNKILHEVIDTEIIEETELDKKIQEVKDEYEINLGVLKFKRTIINKK